MAEKETGYRVEYATSSRTKCKGPKPCAGTAIQKGELRYGNLVEMRGNTCFAWRHWGCVTKKIFENVKQYLSEPSELDGYEDLQPEDQARVAKAWQDGQVADEDIPESARKPETEEAGKAKPSISKKAAAAPVGNSAVEEDKEAPANKVADKPAPEKRAPKMKKEEDDFTKELEDVFAEEIKDTPREEGREEGDENLTINVAEVRYLRQDAIEKARADGNSSIDETRDAYRVDIDLIRTDLASVISKQQRLEEAVAEVKEQLVQQKSILLEVTTMLQKIGSELQSKTAGASSKGK